MLLLVAALACCGVVADRATAQTPKLQPASNRRQRKVANKVEWEPDEIRIASGEKPAAKQSAAAAQTTARQSTQPRGTTACGAASQRAAVAENPPNAIAGSELSAG